MQAWTEGQGYQVKVESDEAIVLNYPDEQEEVAYLNTDNEVHFTSPKHSDNNMSVLVNNISNVDLREGGQVIAYIGEKIIGVGEVLDGRCGLAVWGDEIETETIEGAAKEQAFQLKLWDTDLQSERHLNVEFIREGNGLEYEINDFVVIDVAASATIPDDYYISQNYPNPFNSTTRLAYGLPEVGNLIINVYDVSGRLVSELVNGTLDAGHHVAVWNADVVPAGIYLIRMTAQNGFENSKKVMLIK